MTDEQVRHAIKGIFNAIYSTAKVYEWNVLGHDITAWPGLFRITGGTHGWIIKRAKIDAEWKHGGRERAAWIYDIWGFYKFRSGMENNNSDDEWAVIIDAVRAALKASPDLGLNEVERHELLQVLRNTTIDCGEETLHFAECKLTVNVCC